MAIQQSTVTRNRIRDAFSAAFPAGAIISLRTGAQAGVGGAVGGTELVSITLPATPYATGNGTLTKNNTWSATAAVAGTLAHYRMTNGSDIEEGTITATGGGGDMTVDTVTISAVAQPVEITTFSVTAPYV